MSTPQAIHRCEHIPAPPPAPKRLILLALTLLLPATAQAFDSASTGADGAFAPSINTRLQLPEDGLFNFTTVHIPSGVTVTFDKNTTNTPVVILASGDVNIAGAIHVWGGRSPHAGASGGGGVADDGLPGKGGPGGYDGGMGGPADGNRIGGHGLGPGGGKRGIETTRSNKLYRYGGSGGGHASRGENTDGFSGSWPKVVGGLTYGSNVLLPLIGGSGGGGGFGGNAFAGSGGGGGGGAILIASSGTVSVTGSIRADGAKAGDSSGSNCGTVGGGGSGGGIRIVATTISGNGTLNAPGAPEASHSCSTSGYNIISDRASGGAGRIRLEADTFTRTATTNPPYSFGPPGDLFIAGLPTLRISRVAGSAAPASPTGVADINLPADIVNPVTVEFEATGIPLGNTVKLTLTPRRGSAVTAISNALDGDSNLSTASAQINLPQGPSTLIASISYTLVASLGRRFEHYAGGEKVQRMRVEAGLNGEPRYVLITAGGKEIPLSRAQLAAG